MKSFFFKKVWLAIPPKEILEAYIENLGLVLDDTTYWKGELLDTKIDEGVRGFQIFKPWYDEDVMDQRMATYDSRMKVLQLMREALSTHNYYLLSKTFTKKKFKMYSIIRLDEEGRVIEKPRTLMSKDASFSVFFN